MLSFKPSGTLVTSRLGWPQIPQAPCAATPRGKIKTALTFPKTHGCGDQCSFPTSGLHMLPLCRLTAAPLLQLSQSQSGFSGTSGRGSGATSLEPVNGVKDCREQDTSSPHTKGPGSDANRVFPMLTSGDVLLATRRLQTPIIP
jgi:hypothetical protein